MDPLYFQNLCAERMIRKKEKLYLRLSCYILAVYSLVITKGNHHETGIYSDENVACTRIQFSFLREFTGGNVFLNIHYVLDVLVKCAFVKFIFRSILCVSPRPQCN